MAPYQALSLQTLDDEGNYLPLTELHVRLQCIVILADLREGRGGDYISKKKHDDFLTACQAF